MKHILAAMLLCFLASPASAREMTPHDFAYGVPLATTGRDALCEFPLPAHVYRYVTRGDLGDICVFNGRGEVVPFSLHQVSQPHPAPPEFRSLPLFPLAEVTGKKGDGVTLQVRRSPEGSLIRIETADGKTAGSAISSCLLDAASLKRPVASHELEWEPRPEGTVGRIRVEGSGDELFTRFADQSGGRYQAEVAVTGTPIMLGGESALRRSLVPADPKTALLWSVLLLGVALLAWMAFRLHGQMKKKVDGKDNDVSDAGEGKQS